MNFSNNHSYNNIKIRMSSNYWNDVSWAGLATKNGSNQYTIKLNSSGNPSYARRNKTALHEVCHAFGLNDCNNTNYVINYNTSGSTSTLSSYENSLFINRYGKY